VELEIPAIMLGRDSRVDNHEFHLKIMTKDLLAAWDPFSSALGDVTSK
jgi:hypothetical protein